MASSQRVKSVDSPKRKHEHKQTKTHRGQSVSLASYTIRVRAKRDTQFKHLGAFNEHDSFFDFVRDFISELEGRHAHDALSMSLQRARDVDSDVDTVWGVLEAGDYGYAAELVNVATMKSSYRRATDDAELLPFYFLLNAPADTDKALLIIQRYGNHGVLTEFTNALRVAFEGRFGDYILDIRRHVPGTVIKALKRGELKAIQLTS